MLPSHHSIEVTPADRGLGFGRHHRVAVRRTIGAYERMFEVTPGLGREAVRRLGERAGDSLSGAHPDAVEEIAGIARGAEVGVNDLLAINARTEILAGNGPPECSVVGVLPERSGGPTILAQNWDWHPDLANSLVLWRVDAPGGAGFTTLTEAGILAKVGINDSGLGLCLNILGSSDDGGVGGVPVHVLCRSILERARSLAEAHAILADARATASSCFSVACLTDGASAMASFELCPEGLTTVDPESGVLLHTNHFLMPRPDATDCYRREWPDTELRLEELDARLRRGPARLEPSFVKAALGSHEAGPIAVCCHNDDNPLVARRHVTLASILMRLEEGRIEIAAGAPCRVPFEEFDVATVASASAAGTRDG